MVSWFISTTALESKLVSQFCEDENGALIYNQATNGRWNGKNGNGFGVYGNTAHVDRKSGYNGYHGNNGHSHGNNGNNNFQEEVDYETHTNSRGRGDTFTLPISAEPLPIQVSVLYFYTHVMLLQNTNLVVFSCLTSGGRR